METTNIALSTRKGIPQFADADLRLISHMKRRIINKEPTFLSSVNPIFRETAQVAFMLSSLIHGIKIKPDAPYRSFFCNSHLEAIHGAIKIARHFVYNKKEEDSSGQVYCYDPDRYYVQYFNPMQSEEEELIPGIAFSEKRDLEHWIKKDGNCVALIVSPTYFEQVEQELSVLKKRCEEQEVLLILDLSRSNLELIRKWTAKGYLSHGDIICWGESLANNQFPFGAFSTRHEVYSPWNSLKNCLLHSSTFGGNNMALSFVKGILIEQFPFFESDPAFSQVIKKVEESAAYKVKVYKNYVNAYSEILYRSAKLDANVARAYGAKLFVENKQGQLLEKLDCVGGSGCSARGHNPQDIVPEVLERHRPNIDYWSKLVKQLQQITGLDRLMPGISGASVVEKAMCMALLAQHPSKKRIIVFNGNYAGKTLVAINGTDGDHSYFAPLYAHVEVCNPYLPNSRALVLKALKKGDVALIWFENVQGGSLLSIPPDIISLIKKYQPIYNFYVGIDEILNGVYRTGEFVSFANQDIQPNLITFSKALSDMVHPMAVAIMSEEVYQKARASFPHIVDYLDELYKNQLGAHIALHALEKAEANQLAQNVQQSAPKIINALQPLMRESPIFNSIESRGFHIRLNVNMKAFPFKYFTYENANMIVTSVLYKNGNILSFFGRVFPPLNLSDTEREELIKGLKKTVQQSTMHYFFTGCRQAFSRWWASFWTDRKWG